MSVVSDKKLYKYEKRNEIMARARQKMSRNIMKSKFFREQYKCAIKETSKVLFVCE